MTITISVLGADNVQCTQAITSIHGTAIAMGASVPVLPTELVSIPRAAFRAALADALLKL